MKNLRLAFLVPAFLIAAPVCAQQKHKPAPIRYVTLDKMIRTFAENARSKQAMRPAPKSTAPAVIASR
jgi:hypothetical protein